MSFLVTEAILCAALVKENLSNLRIMTAIPVREKTIPKNLAKLHNIFT